MNSVLGKQCIAVHVYYLASNAYLYDLVLGKQGLHIQVLQIGDHDRVAVQYLASSVQNRSCAQFLHRLVGNTPKPKIAQSAATRQMTLFTEAFLGGFCKNAYSWCSHLQVFELHSV